MKLCAEEGCEIEEGPLTCQEQDIVSKKEVPDEDCYLDPVMTCRFDMKKEIF